MSLLKQLKLQIFNWREVDRKWIETCSTQSYTHEHKYRRAYLSLVHIPPPHTHTQTTSSHPPSLHPTYQNATIKIMLNKHETWGAESLSQKILITYRNQYRDLPTQWQSPGQHDVTWLPTPPPTRTAVWYSLNGMSATLLAEPNVVNIPHMI